MNGAFKGLNQADVYSTSYISKKTWEVSSEAELTSLGIVKYAASSLDPDHKWNGLVQSFYRGALPESGSFSGSYDLSLQSTLTLQGSRTIPEPTPGYGASVFRAYSIPRDLFGETIEEGSISFTASFFKRGSGSIGERTLIDKEGLLLLEENTPGTYSVVGDVIYNQGLIIINGGLLTSILSFKKLKWTSQVTINTWNVRCPVRDLEYNYSYNPTISGSNQEIMGTSKFTPYITTVGLYNRAGELMATAKLSKPIKKNDNIDMTFKVNIDIS